VREEKELRCGKEEDNSWVKTPEIQKKGAIGERNVGEPTL